MLQVGITGGIGSGKSTICKIFELLNISVYNADIEARKILQEDNAIKSRIKEIFGNKILNQNFEIDRTKLAAIVFSNNEKLDQLNAIIHPAIQKKYLLWLQNKTFAPYVLKEAAILFESGSYKNLDFIITVIAPLELRIQRVIDRDKITKSNVMQRIAQQITDEEKIKLSQFIILNNNEELIIPQVLKIHKYLTEPGLCSSKK